MDLTHIEARALSSLLQQTWAQCQRWAQEHEREEQARLSQRAQTQADATRRRLRQLDRWMVELDELIARAPAGAADRLMEQRRAYLAEYVALGQ